MLLLRDSLCDKYIDLNRHCDVSAICIRKSKRESRSGTR